MIVKVKACSNIGFYGDYFANSGIMIVKVKACSNIAQHPVLGTVQSALHFTPWQTCSFQCHLDFSGKHSDTLQSLHEDYSFTYPPSSVASFSFTAE